MQFHTWKLWPQNRTKEKSPIRASQGDKNTFDL